MPRLRSSSGRPDIGGHFAGRSAVVTGGASGIGRALGAELHRHGAHVVLADADGEGAERAAADLAGAGRGTGSITGVRLDVTDAAAVDALVTGTAARHGGLDFIFNNAGISIGGESHEIGIEHWHRLIEVNLNGVVNGVVAAYRQMVAQGHGHIVNTASGAGLAPTVLVAGYSMTKHGVMGLSTSLRPEAADRGVKVSALCPGPVDTPILDSSPPPDLPAPTGSTMSGREFISAMGLRPMPAGLFATQALHGVVRNRSIIVVPPSSGALWWLHRISPAATDRINLALVRRVRRRLDERAVTSG